ncbi:uncharacterized protein LOC109863294 isoform X2 [Pseudomyrmex gracilis]|uniref:uncharacterized protein LOC109863294 isoform X2 n=1 Tax=Pseudomyrmex gracilis TaxID=219809 RepID=UPI000994936F|nr:uncharacterized protein LOC109863294 isoform X2 [Pseudomyrmex gracilis]
MGGVLSAIEAKDRWRYLRDCYSKAKKKENEYIPSGSGAEQLLKRKNPFRFNQKMSFLDDVMLGKSPTCSSLTINTANTDKETRNIATNEPAKLVPVPLDSRGSNESDCSEDAIICNSVKKKKLDKSKNDHDFHDSVIAALRDPIKETDAVDGFLITLGEGLRKLPYKERSVMQIKFLSLIMEKQEQLEYL